MTALRLIPSPRAACALLLLCVAGRVSADPYVVAALAADARAVVLTAPDGHLQRYRSGELLADSAWRVIEVRATEVVFARSLPGSKGALNVGVRAGDTVDFAALDLRYGAPAAPKPTFQFRLNPLPKR